MRLRTTGVSTRPDYLSSYSNGVFFYIIRHILNREDVNNSLIMIQPTLMCYTLNNPTEPEPVLLDSVSIRNDAILLLDTFFHVLIWHGEMIAGWRKAKYHEQPEYANLKTLLETPKVDAQVLFFLKKISLPP
jgi:protein transport protein SEC23